jgi:cyclopropane-fatty-acyl-phospholipid synthase
MTSTSVLENIEKYIPLVGDVNIKTPLAYKASRGAVR